MADSRLSERKPSAKIPFIDLAAQQRRFKPELDRAIARVLEGGNYIMGREVAELEGQLAAFAGARHCISCANGTDALQLVLMAEDIGPGDAVIVPTFTFVATAEAVMERRATPVFADVDASTFNLCVDSLKRCVAQARAAGLRPRAVIAVDLFGLPADYRAINEIASTEGLTVIADAAQAFGAARNGAKVGGMAKYTTTSFFPAKPLGCYGDGGAIFTDDDDARALLDSLRFHGKGTHKYENIRIGLSSRLDTLQAAILIEKLKIFPEEIESRNRIADRYTAALANNAVAVPRVPDGALSVWAQYTLILPEGIDRESLQRSLQESGVPTVVYYPNPLHLMGVYASNPVDPDGVPVSEMLAKRVLSLPMHAYLTTDTQGYIVDRVREVLGRSS